MELQEIIEQTPFEPIREETEEAGWTALLDRELNIVSTNTACEPLFGWDPEEITGKRLGDLINLAPLTSLIVTGFCFKSEPAKAHGKNLSCSYVPLLQDNKSIGGFLTITQRYAPLEGSAETGLQTNLAQALGPLMDIVQDGLIVLDRQGFITLANQHFADALGVRAQDMIGKHIFEAYSDSKASRMPIVMETGQAEIGWPHLINGKEVVACRYPLFKDGEVVGALGRILFRDVREVTLLANQLQSLMGQETKKPPAISKHCDFHYDVNSIVGNSKSMRELKSTLLRVAKRGSGVLLIGESGTGKELLAHSLHAASERRYGPFIKVNCAAIPEHLLESELFGYSDGAFTGARKGGQIGKFELAHGGSLFLDEISDMSITMQAKLLRVLQEKEITPLGSEATRKFDVRVITATNINMERMVEEGKFRRDLYYRLNIVSVRVPPLRQRTEDIPLLVKHFIDTFNEEFGLKITGLTQDAWDLLKSYDFPGNIRELRNLIESAFNVVNGPLIRKSDLPEQVLLTAGRIPLQPVDLLAAAGLDGENNSLPDILDAVEKYLIEDAIARCGGNKNEASTLLGISRPGIYKKLQKHKIQ